MKSIKPIAKERLNLWGRVAAAINDTRDEVAGYKAKIKSRSHLKCIFFGEKCLVLVTDKNGVPRAAVELADYKVGAFRSVMAFGRMYETVRQDIGIALEKHGLIEDCLIQTEDMDLSSLFEKYKFL